MSTKGKPPDMRQQLMLNQHRLDTAEAISDKFEEYCEAVEGFNNDAKESPGCVAIVTEKGVPYNFGKGGTRGKGKCIGDLDISVRGVSSEWLEGSAIGVCELATRKHSVGSSQSV